MTFSASADEVSASISTVPSSVSTAIEETQPALSIARLSNSITGAGAGGSVGWGRPGVSASTRAHRTVSSPASSQARSSWVCGSPSSAVALAAGRKEARPARAGAMVVLLANRGVRRGS
ncbi:hypothetical protein AMK19_07270 [Kitasatospora sp. CB01950]|nr:hypothetical protein AMK19_07270 [Kitasatospora sp. CB01950]